MAANFDISLELSPIWSDRDGSLCYLFDRLCGMSCCFGGCISPSKSIQNLWIYLLDNIWIFVDIYAKAIDWLS